MAKISVLLILAAILFTSISADFRRRQMEMRILDRLLNSSRYDPRVRPSGTEQPDSPVAIKVSIYLLDVYQENPHSKEFIIHCYLRQRWKDSRLEFWKISQTIDKISLKDYDQIWSPDLFVLNSVKTNVQDLLTPNYSVHIEKDGMVLIASRLTLHTRCSLDLRYFPHDQQSCSITIESFGHYADDITLEWDARHYKSAHDEKINRNAEAYSLIDMDVFSATGKTGNRTETEYSTLQLQLLLTRNFNSYFWSLYLPFVILVLLSGLCFLLGSESFQSRMFLHALVLILMLRLSPDFDNIKMESSMPTALVFWVLGCLSFVVVAVLESLFVHRQATRHKYGEKTKVQKIDQEEKALSQEDNESQSLRKRIFSKKYWHDCMADCDQMDAVSSIAFPLAFLLFNIVYWSVCYSGRCSNIEEWKENMND